MRLKLEFKIVFSSDYHIGAGHGLGAGIDSALLRDGDGVPVIRGTTVAGLLRDGLWRLLQTEPMKARRACQASGLTTEETDQRYCGQSSAHNDGGPCPICRIFGTPREQKHWLIHSARPNGHMKVSAAGGVPPMGSVVQRVRINPRTRRAEARKLFSQEEGSAETEFHFSITSPTNSENALDEAALLVAAARNVREMGRSRNRGRGQCLISLVSVTGTDGQEEDWQTVFLDRFQEKWLANGQPAPRGVVNLEYQPIETDEECDGPVRVRLILRTDEPLLIAGRAEAGNMYDSRNLIPGATIRGALAWIAAQRFDLEAESKAYSAFVNTFLHGEVRFPFLYPAQYQNMRLTPAIPPPLDMFTCKSAIGKPKEGHGIWFASQGLPPEGECPTCGSQLTNEASFLLIQEHAWGHDKDYRFNLNRSSEMHIQIDPRSRRVVEGQLFGYVVVDAGQFFVGDLICDSDDAWQRLQTLTGIGLKTPVELKIGKASRRGYGRVTAWFKKVPVNDNAWRLQPLEESQETLREITLTLLSDAIVTDRWGRYALGFDRAWLHRELKFEVEKIIYAAARTRQVDGFNTHLGLPRWRDVAITAGSTARLVLSRAVDFSRLEKIERQGIGLRRNEGFGQVAFDHPVYNHCQGINNRIKLDDSLALKLVFKDSKAEFLRDWAKNMDKNTWTDCASARFLAVARWLVESQNSDPSILVNDLQTFGRPTEAWRSANLPDFHENSKENKLQSEEKGIELVVKLLKELGEMDDQFWPDGLALLADRIATATDQKLA